MFVSIIESSFRCNVTWLRHLWEFKWKMRVLDVFIIQHLSNTTNTSIQFYISFFFYFYYADFNKYPLFLNQYYMNGKVFKNIVGYGDLMKARTKFVHSGMHIFTDWKVWADGWLVPIRYPSQCFDGERKRNIFKIIEWKIPFSKSF